MENEEFNNSQTKPEIVELPLVEASKEVNPSRLLRRQSSLFLSYREDDNSPPQVIKNFSEMKDDIDKTLGRIVKINEPQEKRFVQNTIKNTKYNIITFLPKNLFEQFRRIANFYFLIVAILGTIPSISPFSPATIWGALAFILLANALKEMYEDFQRFRNDRKINYSIVEVLEGNDFKSIYWKDVRVGDILRVKKDELFPADLLTISSSFEDGQCYVETSNLDGETNLKTIQAPAATCSIQTVEELTQLKGYVQCENPNSTLTKFVGLLKLPDRPFINIGISQLLLRGTALKNTDWTFGLVIYTGKETKVLMNTGGQPSKRSRIERIMNKILIGLFIILGVFCVICGILSASWQYQNSNAWYIPAAFNYYLDGFLSIFTFFLLYNGVVPLALYVSIELVRVGQKWFLNRDDAMYYEPTKTYAECKNSNLNEELGQIDIILSDKTGTLTQNQMDLRSCSIAGISYGNYIQTLDTSISEKEIITESMVEPKFYDSNLKEKLEKGQTLETHFFKALSICHSALPDKFSDSEVHYQSSSPDEIALLEGAAQMGFIFKERTTDKLKLEILGKDETFEILHTFEFTSERKRMSVVCKDQTGKILLYSKGAENVMFERLDDEKQYLQETTDHLTKYATAGLRILVITYLELDSEYYENWRKKYYEESKSISSNRQEKLEKLYSELEKNLKLLGCTGIEDELQFGVPETIDMLLRAGIKIWVLTGDKQETAVNIGNSCKLISGKKLLILNDNSGNSNDILNQINKWKEEVQNSTEPYAIVVSGKANSLVLDHSISHSFVELGNMVDSVLFCRCTPLQKASVVKLVRETSNKNTLAVGDGANDVPMIQSAHVGVGIYGKEGSQAALASDYSISQFRFLSRLLLVHGRYCYRRMTLLIFYVFYKQLAVTALQFFFAIDNGFSGTTLYDSNLINAYDIAFASVPIIILGVWDRDLPAVILTKYPALYKPLQKDVWFNQRNFWIWIVYALYNSVMNYYIGMYTLTDCILKNGQIGGYWVQSIAIYTCATFVVNFVIALEMKSWTWLHHLTVWGSIILWNVFVIGLCAAVDYPLYGADWQLYSSPVFYFYMLVTIAISLLPNYAFKFVKRTWFPTSDDICQEIAYLKRKKIIDINTFQ